MLFRNVILELLYKSYRERCIGSPANSWVQILVRGQQLTKTFTYVFAVFTERYLLLYSCCDTNFELIKYSSFFSNKVFCLLLLIVNWFDCSLQKTLKNYSGTEM